MEPESLDEQALQETANDPPEYQHPEWVFEEYERITDEQLGINNQES